MYQKDHKHTFDGELWPEQEARNPPARHEVQYSNDNLVCVLDWVVNPKSPRLQSSSTPCLARWVELMRHRISK